MDEDFMNEVVVIRGLLGFAFPVTSGYRCPNWNDTLYDLDGKHRDGPHVRGHALDINIHYKNVHALTQEATRRGWRVGLNQKGEPHSRYIHIDDLPNRTIWTY